jgi:hypothetical protein
MCTTNYRAIILTGQGLVGNTAEGADQVVDSSLNVGIVGDVVA